MVDMHGMLADGGLPVLELGQLSPQAASHTRPCAGTGRDADLARGLQEVQVMPLGIAGCLVASEGVGQVRLRFLPPHICMGNC